MSTLGQRLVKAIKFRNASKSGLASYCGVSKSAVTQWCNESTNDLKMANLFSVSEFLKIRPEWLGTGQGRMLADDEYLDTSQLGIVYVMEENQVDDFLAGTFKPERKMLTGEVLEKGFAFQPSDVQSKEVFQGQLLIFDAGYQATEGARIALIKASGHYMVRDVSFDGPALFFTGGSKDWPAVEVEFIAGVCAVAEESKKSLT